jgi:Family of unknown function (DUF5687)
MFKKFLYLEWKSFTRSSAFATSLILKIVMIFFAIYFALCFLAFGIGAFYIMKDQNLEPLKSVNKFLIYYFVMDLVIRLMLQKIPVMNIRPLLTLPFKKDTIVHFSLGKTIVSFFNLLHLFFFLPFSIVLIIEGFDVLSVIFWYLSMISIIYINNFLNIILNNKDNLFVIFLIIVSVLAACQYYNVFDITNYTSVFFNGLFNTTYLIIIPVMVLVGLYLYTFKFFKANAFLDAGLSSKTEIATTENLTWLNQFGTLGTFLKNDIKLIKRNKRSKTTIAMSFLFLFYGLLFFRENSHQPQIMHILAGIFVSGGFLFTFGQFVPSWDSAYYQLMMTQNVPYRNYITSKWWLIVIATTISTLLASFYLYFGLQVYLCILAGAIYNIGVNSHLVLYAGAYTKTPVDLSSSKGAFGDKKAFNVQTMLIALPKLLIPLALYGFGYYVFNQNTGLILVAIAGILGFSFRNKMFTIIEKIYKKEKYKTIAAYKQVAA